MKSKALKITIGILLILIAISLLIVAYFMFVDIQTKEPETVKQNYHLSVEEFKGRKIFTISPKEGTTNPKTILYFHGGSYVAEATDQHWEFITDLVNDTKAKVILPDYPLTPKYDYQDVMDMVIPMYEKLIKETDPNSIIMMGDSAGGGLAMGLAEKLGEKEIPVPGQLVLISPWLDVTMKNPNIEEVQAYDHDLNKEALKVAGIAYAGKEGMDDYFVNPIQGPLTHLKNVTIFTGTYDILNPDAKKLVSRAKEEGISIELKEYETAPHIWIVKKNSHPTDLAKQSYEDLLKVLDK
jgi:acetyl esterase/lipase